jgi:phosphate:Na+ symporter
MEAVSNLENIGDVIETNLVDLGYDRIDAGISISAPTRKVLTGFHRVIGKACDAAIQAVSQNNQQVAQTVLEMKQEISRLADSAAVHQAQRLVAEEPNRIPAYTIEIDIIEKQKRIYYFAKRMAKTVVPPEDDEV